MVASEGGSPVGDEPARTPRCAPSVARGRKSKKAAHFCAGVETIRESTARSRNTTRTGNQSRFLRVARFFHARRNPCVDPLSPLSRAAPLESSWVRDSRIRRTRRVRLFSTAELARKRFRDGTVSALGFRSDAFTIRTIRAIRKILRFTRWKTETHLSADDEMCTETKGSPRKRKRKSLLYYAYAPLRRVFSRRKRQKSIHATLSKMNVPPAPFARPMSVSSSRYVT